MADKLSVSGDLGANGKCEGSARDASWFVRCGLLDTSQAPHIERLEEGGSFQHSASGMASVVSVAQKRKSRHSAYLVTIFNRVARWKSQGIRSGDGLSSRSNDPDWNGKDGEQISRWQWTQNWSHSHCYHVTTVGENSGNKVISHHICLYYSLWRAVPSS